MLFAVASPPQNAQIGLALRNAWRCRVADPTALSYDTYAAHVDYRSNNFHRLKIKVTSSNGVLPWKLHGSPLEVGNSLLTNDRSGQGLRIRRNGKLPFDVISWAMAGDGSTPAAYAGRANGGNGR